MTNLITIDDFKQYKAIKSENDDPTISLLIGAVSNFVKEYTNRDFIDYSNTDKIEYFDAMSYGEYLPKEFPLLSVTELAVSTDGGVTNTVLVEDTDYFVDLATDVIINNTIYYGFTTGTITHKSGKLTYKGGYVETPIDLKLATMDLVEYYRKEDYTPGKALQGASVENFVLVQTGSHLPPHIKRVLDLYRVL